MDFTELKYRFDEIFNLWLNEVVIKAQMYEENIMLTYLNMMIDSLNNIEVQRHE